MSWVRIADEFPDNPKVQGLSDRAFRYYVTALCYASRNLTDGVLDTKTMRFIAISAENTRPSVSVGELVEHGLLVPVETENGPVLAINDYHEYNPTAKQIKEDRRKAAERMKRWRANRYAATNAVSNGVTSPEGTLSPSRPLITSKEVTRNTGQDCPICGVTKNTDQALQDHMANVHDHQPT